MSDSSDSDDDWRSNKRKPEVKQSTGVDLEEMAKQAREMKKLKTMKARSEKLKVVESKNDEINTKEDAIAAELMEKYQEDTQDELFFNTNEHFFIADPKLPMVVHGLAESEASVWAVLLEGQMDDELRQLLGDTHKEHIGTRPEPTCRILVHLALYYGDRGVQSLAFRLYEAFLQGLPGLPLEHRLLNFGADSKRVLPDSGCWIPSTEDLLGAMVAHGARPDSVSPGPPEVGAASAVPSSLQASLRLSNISMLFHLLGMVVETRPSAFSSANRVELLRALLRSSLDPNTQLVSGLDVAITVLLRACGDADLPALCACFLVVTPSVQCLLRLLGTLPQDMDDTIASEVRRRCAFAALTSMLAVVAAEGEEDRLTIEVLPEAPIVSPSVQMVVSTLKHDAMSRSPGAHMPWFYSVVSLSQLASAGLEADPHYPALVQVWKQAKSRVQGFSKAKMKFKDLVDVLAFSCQRLTKVPQLGSGHLLKAELTAALREVKS